MQNSVYWQRIYKQRKQAAEAEKIVDFLLNSSWEEVQTRSDIFDKVLDPDNYSAADRIQSYGTVLLDRLFKNSQTIPTDAQATVLTKFANFDLKQGAPGLKKLLSPVYPYLEINETEDWVALQKEVQQALNALNNVHKIAIYKVAEDNFTEVIVLKKLSSDQVKNLQEKVKQSDNALAESINNKKPMSKEDEAQLHQVLEASGRVGMEIEDLSSDEGQTMAIDILRNMIKSLTIVERAQKDNTLDDLNSVDGIAKILEKVLDEIAQKQLQEIGGIKPPMQNIGSNVSGNVSTAI